MASKGLVGLIGLIAGAVVVALVVAGCGGDSDEVSAASLPKPRFVKQADDICREGIRSIETDFGAYIKENKSLANPGDLDYAGVVDTVMAPSLERELEELRELGAPSGDEEQVEAVWTALEEGLEDGEANPRSAVTSNALFAKSSKPAEKYGFEICGQ